MRSALIRRAPSWARATLRLGALMSLISLVAAPIGASHVAAATQQPTPGTGTATAYAANAAIQTGGAAIGLATYLRGFARFADTTARAEAELFDPGIVRLVASLEECGTHGLDPSTLPQPLIADTSQSSGKPVSRAQTSAGNSATGAGTIRATATPNAVGHSESTGGAAALPGVFSMTAADVRTAATWDPKRLERTVSAETIVGHLALLGAVELDGLHWSARQVVTGVDSRTSKRTPPTTSFSVGAIKLGGVPIPTTTPQEVAAAMAAVNAAVKPLGLTITLPTIVVNGSGAEVTPLTASLTGNAALRSVLGPLYTAKDSKGNLIVNDVEQALKPSVWDPANCDELFGVLKSQPQLNAGWNQLGAGYPIVLGAVMAALTGGGSVDVHLGDAKVSVDDTYFSPIDFGGFGFDVSGGGGSFSTPGIAGGPTLLALAPGVAAPGAAAAPPPGSVVAATSTRCETTSPFGHPMCWGGHGAAAAAGVLGATVVLLAADELTRRRRRRPEAV